MGVGFEDQRGEAPNAVALIVQDLSNRSLQTVIAAIASDACVIGKALGVIAETQLIIRLVEVSVRNKQLSLAVAFKPTTRNGIKHSIGPVTIFGRVTSTL